MTLYGIDVASYQAGLNLAEVKAESYDFIIAKATEGNGWPLPCRPPVPAGWPVGTSAHHLSLLSLSPAWGNSPAAVPTRRR